MWCFTTRTVQAIASLFDAEQRKQISGVVGSYETLPAGRWTSTSSGRCSCSRVISLSLGVINLFPFLPLDGGHIFWALAEKVRGRAIPFASWSAPGSSGSCS